MSAIPHLRLIDSETGEIREHSTCPTCEAAREEAETWERKLLAADREIQRLKADKDAERLKDPKRHEIEALFDYWTDRCRHPNAKLDGARHDLIKRALKSYTVEQVRMAIDGASVDAYVDAKGKRHDGLGLILRDAEHTEDFANRWHRFQTRGDA